MSEPKTANTVQLLLTPEETARLLGVTPGTLSIWRCSRRYPLAFVKVGGRVRYKLSDVEKFVERRTVVPRDRRVAAA